MNLQELQVLVVLEIHHRSWFGGDTTKKDIAVGEDFMLSPAGTERQVPLDSIRAELVKSVAGTGEWNTKGIGFFAAAWERIWQRRGPRRPSISRHFWIWLMGLGLGTRCCLEFICGQRLHGLTMHLAMMCWRAAYSAVRTCDRIRLCTHGSQAPALATMKTDNLAVTTTRSASLSKTALEEAGGIYIIIYIINYIYMHICEPVCLFFHSIWDWSWLAFRQTCIAYVFFRIPHGCVWTHLDWWVLWGFEGRGTWKDYVLHLWEYAYYFQCNLQ